MAALHNALSHGWNYFVYCGANVLWRGRKNLQSQTVRPRLPKMFNFPSNWDAFWQPQQAHTCGSTNWPTSCAALNSSFALQWRNRRSVLLQDLRLTPALHQTWTTKSRLPPQQTRSCLRSQLAAQIWTSGYCLHTTSHSQRHEQYQPLKRSISSSFSCERRIRHDCPFFWNICSYLVGIYTHQRALEENVKQETQICIKRCLSTCISIPLWFFWGRLAERTKLVLLCDSIAAERKNKPWSANVLFSLRNVTTF